MPTYCKAYTLAELRRFAEWEGEADPRALTLADDTICYIHESLKVTETCFEDGASLLGRVTPEWEAFCTGTLGFAVPEDIREARAALGDRPRSASEPAPGP